jgi:hypothetical protein
MDIIKANLPQTTISKDYLNLTYRLIDATRKSREIERPASIRSALAIVKLAVKRSKSNNSLSLENYKEIANFVLRGGIKARPGFDESKVASKIIDAIVQ